MLNRVVTFTPFFGGIVAKMCLRSQNGIRSAVMTLKIFSWVSQKESSLDIVPILMDRTYRGFLSPFLKSVKGRPCSTKRCATFREKTLIPISDNCQHYGPL